MTPLEFIPAIARQKPTNQDACPFCNLAGLEKIIDQTGDFLWLDNKYPTIKDTYQTLVIESQEHLGDIATIPMLIIGAYLIIFGTVLISCRPPELTKVW